MSGHRAIYLDHAASTPCDPRVAEAMLPYFTESFANPSSRSHAPGRAIAEVVEDARQRAAGVISAAPEEIIWTSGASESNNLALTGTARALARAPAGGAHRGHIVASAFEHKAVLNPARALEREGFDLTLIDPPGDGVITAGQVEAAMRDDTILVSIIWVNNEIGTVSEIPAIGALCQARGVLFHTDATQRIGMRSVDVVRDGIDLLSFSGHKICGPKGSGALYARRRDGAVALEPIIHGGAHEGGLRAGTLNVPGIVGLARALEICRDEMEEEATRLARLRDHLEESLRARIEGVLVNGDPQRRAPHVSNLCFASVRGVALIDHVEEVACSSGAAISSSGRAVSHVLRAIGVPDDLAVTSLRLSLGRFTTEEEIDAAVDALARVVQEAESVRAARR